MVSWNYVMSDTEKMQQKIGTPAAI
jgi:hypothetical protein